MGLFTVLLWPLIKWTLPELSEFESRHEKIQAVEIAWQRIQTKRLIVLFAIVLIIPFGVIELLHYMFRDKGPIAEFVGGEPMYWVIAMLAMACIFLFCQNSLRREIRAQLAARGMTICVECGYDVRGQVELRCPECGAPTVKR
jgi:hypothetical protein